MTAIKVGRVVMHLHHHEKLGAILPEGAGEWNERIMLASGQAAPWMAKFYESEKWRAFVTWFEDHTMRGATLAYGLRKRFVDAEVKRALAAGAKQVLMVGAGFDSLCARLAPQYPDAVFLEIDHPETQKTKLQALETMGALAPNLFLDPVDLGERNLHDVLAGLEVWDCDTQSVIVAEAVLAYLDEGAVTRFFDDAHRSSGPSSTLLFTHMQRRPDGKLYFGEVSALLERSLELVGEPLKWVPFPSEVGALLARHGWRLVTDPARNDLRTRFLVESGLGDEPAGDAERFAVAERMG